MDRKTIKASWESDFEMRCRPSLEGKWFWKQDSRGQVSLQGEILEACKEGYRVRFYGYGEPTTPQTVSLEDVAGWELFDNKEAFDLACYKLKIEGMKQAHGVGALMNGPN